MAKIEEVRKTRGGEGDRDGGTRNDDGNGIIIYYTLSGLEAYGLAISFLFTLDCIFPL